MTATPARVLGSSRHNIAKTDFSTPPRFSMMRIAPPEILVAAGRHLDPAAMIAGLHARTLPRLGVARAGLPVAIAVFGDVSTERRDEQELLAIGVIVMAKAVAFHGRRQILSRVRIGHPIEIPVDPGAIERGDDIRRAAGTLGHHDDGQEVGLVADDFLDDVLYGKRRGAHHGGVVHGVGKQPRALFELSFELRDGGPIGEPRRRGRGGRPPRTNSNRNLPCSERRTGARRAIIMGGGLSKDCD